MKKYYQILSISCMLLLSMFEVLSSDPPDEVIKLEQQENLYMNGRMYIGGQPTLETLKWLTSEGVTLVVNLRSREETEEFKKSSFNEEAVVQDLGMHYVSIPMSGRNAYNPLTLMSLNETLKGHHGKILIHCGGAGRATNMYMAYLVKYQDLTINEAMALGRQMAFYFPFGDLLGGQLQISMQ